VWASAVAVRGPLAVLALLAFVLSGSLIAGDRLVAAHTTDAYRSYLAAQPAAQTDLTAVSTMTAASAATLAQATARTNALLPSGLVGAVSPVHTAVVEHGGVWRKPVEVAARSVSWPPELSLAYSPQAAAAAHYVQGSAPACPAGGCTRGAVLPISVSQHVATELGLAVGSTFTLDPPDSADGALTLRVAGVFVPSASAGYAFDDLPTLDQPRLAEWVPQRGQYAGETNTQWDAEVLIDPAALSVVTAWQPAEATWRYHLEPAALSGSGAAALSAEIKSRISSANQLGLGGAFADDVFSTRLAPVLDSFATLDASANALADFALAGTAAIALAVLFLAIRILLGRQSAAVALLRARGASGSALAIWVGFQTLLACVPSTALALVSCRVLIAGPEPAAGHATLEWAVAAATAFGAPALAAVAVARGPSPAASSRRRRRASQWIGRGTALLVGLATVAGVRMRAGTGTGVDPLTALLPTVLAVDAAVLISMLIPVAVRPAARLAARGRGLVGYLSAASAARRPTVDLVTAGALTAAATAAVFASCFTGTLTGARIIESWQSVGADLRISSTADSGGVLDQSALNRVASSPGIAAHAEATVLGAQQLLVPQGGLEVTVYVIDPAEYRGLIRGTPLDVPAAEAELDTLANAHATAGTVPALVSPDLLALVQGLPAGSPATVNLSENTLDLAPLGSAAAFPPAAGSQACLVISAAGLHQAMPNFPTGATIAWYTYRPGVTSAPATAAQVPASSLSARAAVIGGYGSDLLSALSAWISRSAGVLDVLLSAACVLLAAAATARARAASSTFLLTMGTRRRSAAAVSVLETMPMLAAIGAAAVGAGYGAAEALLPAVAAIGAVPRPAAAALPAGAVLVAAAVPLLGVLVTTAGAGFGREAQLSFQRTGG
jgi:putative ABC transport system permease protein